MHKKLASLALFLAILPVQAYAQTDKAQQSPKGDQPTTPIAPVAPEQTDSPPLQSKHQDHVQADVRVVKTPDKDGYDYASFWAGIVLTAVGIGGVGVGIGTLLFIKGQVIEMRRQRIVMQKTLLSIRRQSDAMDKQNKDARDRERARLIIRQLEIPEMLPPDSAMGGDRAVKVRVIVENLGSSRAFNVRAWGIMSLTSERDGDNYDVGVRQQLPSIIDANEEKHFLNITSLGKYFEGTAMTGEYTAITEELAHRLREGEIFLVASGTLVYEDLFGDTFEAPFHFIWHSFGNDDGRMWMTDSYWLDRSPRPRRVHAGKTQEDTSQNPN